MAQTEEISKEAQSRVAHQEVKQAPLSTWVSEITPKKPLLHLPLREIWRYRDLIALTVWRDFISLHKQTIIGPFWYFVQPLVSTVVYQIVFGKIAGLPTNSIPPFLFYMSGIVIWYYFSACLSRTSNTFSANAGLFTKVYFPRLTIPISQCISNIWQFLIQLLDFSGLLCLFFGQGGSHSSQLPDYHHPFSRLPNRAPRAGRRMSYFRPEHALPRLAGGCHANDSTLDVRQLHLLSAINCAGKSSMGHDAKSHRPYYRKLPLRPHGTGPGRNLSMAGKPRHYHRDSPGCPR